MYFVIGAGPSLSQNHSQIKKNTKKQSKIAADSALKPLLENKIVPDISCNRFRW